VGDAIMAAGGPGGGVDPANTTIERSGVVIMPKEAFRQALIDGKTLDQLNLRAGDEFLIGGYRVQTAGRRGAFSFVLPVISAIVSISYLATRIF